MLITDEIFQAFLSCETKSYFKFLGDVGLQHKLIEFEQNRLEDFKQKCLVKLCSNFEVDEYLIGESYPKAFKNSKYHLIGDCVLHAQGLRSHIHALERSTTPDKGKYNPFIPIRFLPNEKITKSDKLLLMFDALVLYTASGKLPQFGKIIHNSKQRVTKVNLIKLMEITRTIISKIIALQTSHTVPQLILNKHCTKCEFQSRCREKAIEKDELTLLSGMTKEERKRQHNKGIFSVTQLSYTFRARRRPKRLASTPEKYSPALRALAIREHKIHIAGKLDLTLKGNPIFLDVEGISDQNFYYLIGLRFKNADLYVQHSFWANERVNEKEIWASALEVLARIDNPQLVHYGSYETVFLKRMKERYPDIVEDASFLDQLINKSVNILSIIYAQIYFPTYSNGLKEIARYLGFRWSDNTASGLYSLMWRLKWEFSKDSTLKNKILVYNAEDCEALEKVTTTVVQLCKKQTNLLSLTENGIIHTDTLKQERPLHFGKINFLVPELEQINQAAYWHYQRGRTYVKSDQRLKRINKIQTRTKLLPINKVIALEERPSSCFKCKATKIYKYGRMTKILYDLKFSRAGMKRWVVKYCFDRYICWKCRASFYLEKRPWTGSKYGSELSSYVIYQIIELRLAQRAVAQSLNELFRFNLNRGSISRLKTEAAQLYKITYGTILNKIVTGKLIHADETKISLIRNEGFVWVVTNMEEVVYFYTDTREGDTIHAMLKDFQGVLVSDFYAVYDAINCPQQKCLIHLIRDMNGDLHKHPFNEELTELVQDFTLLLKAMIETIDRFGLKTYFLRKHKISVEHFYKRLSIRKYESDVAVNYKKRFNKNREKLFTFLDYDNVPWNNNNAEHAIKAFARLRNVIGGTSSDNGIQEYLTLLSINETCKYKGISFLDFLRSGEKDIDTFEK
ncbi:TM0106 family RecB-like putative nuclease [Candidatus Latescibacterota bacterium]